MALAVLVVVVGAVVVVVVVAIDCGVYGVVMGFLAMAILRGLPPMCVPDSAHAACACCAVANSIKANRAG